MNLFRRRTPEPVTTDLTDRVAMLTRRIEDGERALRSLQLEWSDTLERLNRLAGRLAKRAERASSFDQEQLDTPGPVNGAGEAMAEVQKRRNRTWPGGGR